MRSSEEARAMHSTVRMRRKIAILACALGVGALAVGCDASYGGYYGSDYYAGYPYDYPYAYPYDYPYYGTRFGVVVRPGFRGDERFEHERHEALEHQHHEAFEHRGFEHGPPRQFSRGPAVAPPSGRRRF
ncbi:MAG TPA: hypothetical protein VFF06_29080 [Polyangia bacterium]|nr:hypothetical protein [Polyangia bacterium]